MTDRNAILEALTDAIRDACNGTPEAATEAEVTEAIAAAVLELCGPRPLVWLRQSHDCYVAHTVFGDTAVQNESHALALDRWGWWIAGSGEDDDPAGYAVTLEAAQSAAQAHADAAHWANTALGAMIGGE